MELATKQDLEWLRQELVKEFKLLLLPAPTATRAWLRSREVRSLLKISAGTLQQLRVSGQLHASKIGGIWYYSENEIDQLLKGGPCMGK